MIGTELGNYRILEELGEGGMGVVYKAVDTSIDRLVAVKVLSSELTRNPELVERFRSEARAQGNLNHTNIATLYTFLAQGGQAWMVMEYIEGENLSQMLERRGLLPPDVAIPLFKQALLGIGFAHRMGIVHRDVKPSNLMVNRLGIVKVMDFGIAKVMGSRGLTRTGTALGTAFYMSPEQVMNTQIDVRSDIYSLGVTLYEMLTANLPFQGDSDFHIMSEHLYAAPPPPSRYYPYIPKGIENAVLKAMAKDPNARFQTVEEFGAALEHPDDFGISWGAPAPVTATQMPVPAPGAPPPPPLTGGLRAPTPPPGSGQSITGPSTAMPPVWTPPPPPPARSTPPPPPGRSTPPPLSGTVIANTPPPSTPLPGTIMAPAHPTPVPGAGYPPPPPGPGTPPPVRPVTPPPLPPPQSSFLGSAAGKAIVGIGALAVLAASYFLLRPHPTPVIQEQTHNTNTNPGGDTSGTKKNTDEVVTVWPPKPPDPGTSTELKIVQFVVNTKRVVPGQKARLVWTVQGASEVTISPAVGTVDAQGARDVAVDRTTQFVLSARKLTGEEVHETVVVEVGPAPPQEPKALEVAFSAQPNAIVAGQSTLLRWSVPGAAIVTIAPGIGTVPPAGSMPVKPVQTLTYHLEARAKNGATGSSDVTVQVQPPQVTPPPQQPVRPEISFEAVPNTIQQGGSATLRWNLKNAVAATISPAPGTLRQTGGQVAVSPPVTTTYTLTAKSHDGTLASAQAVVQVVPAQQQQQQQQQQRQPPPAGGRNSAMITVFHDHGGTLNVSVWPNCYGALQVVNGVLRYAVAGSTDGRADGFEIPISQVQEVKLNRLRIRNQPAFHVMIRGQHFNFVPTGMAAAQAANELEAAVGKR